MRWYSSACPVCRGDLHDDPMDQDWVMCMMCAREFAAEDLLEVQRARRYHAAAQQEFRPAA
jgi:hypothetical protein